MPSEPEEKQEAGFSGEIETSAQFFTGNIKRESFLLASMLQYDWRDWRTTIEGRAFNNKENDVRTAEEYRLSNRTDYKFDDSNFAFGEVNYVNDRFSGFDYRISEIVGLGRTFYDSDIFYWQGRVGIGARQDKLTDGEQENRPLFNLATDLEYTFSEWLSLTEDADISATTEATIIESETALKSKIIDQLALKAAFYIEHITDVPENAVDTDTRTTVGVVYDF
jgi:putative salt-induced outer membrane protein